MHYPMRYRTAQASKYYPGVNRSPLRIRARWSSVVLCYRVPPNSKIIMLFYQTDNTVV